MGVLPNQTIRRVEEGLDIWSSHKSQNNNITYEIRETTKRKDNIGTAIYLTANFAL